MTIVAYSQAVHLASNLSLAQFCEEVVSAGYNIPYTYGMQRVVAAVIERDGLLLVCRRPAHKQHGGLWEFPGGKLEPEETLEQAAARELAEELSLQVTQVGTVRFASEDVASGYVIEFVNVTVTGDLHLNEHSAFQWVRCDQLCDLPLAPTDRQFAEFLQGSDKP